MTVTLDWTVALGLLVWTALAFWLGKASSGGSRDLIGPPSGMSLTKPPTSNPVAPAAPSATMPSGLRPDQIDAIRGELANGNKIMAIKLYREATGLGLAEAKQAVEAMAG